MQGEALAIGTGSDAAATLQASPNGNGRGPDQGLSVRLPIYCVIPKYLVDDLYASLSDYWREDSSIAVIVERRERDRRQGQRRNGSPGTDTQRRCIRNVDGRRVAERRATLVRAMVRLPRRAKRHADQIAVVQRVNRTEREIREEQSARLIVAFQGGDDMALPELYELHFEDVYSYERVFLKDDHEAEDATQQVFLNLLEALPRYELRPGVRFASWLFRIARNEALMHRRKHGRVQVEEPSRIAMRCSDACDDAEQALGWISDGDLLRFVESLPEGQRQTLSLRYMLGMDTAEIAAVLDRSPQAVRKLEHRALRFLEKRLITTGHAPRGARRSPMLTRIRGLPVMRQRRFALAAPLTPTVARHPYRAG